MNKRIEYLSVGLFFILLLLLGLGCYRDYGISWDEPSQRLTGAVTVNYVAEALHTPKFMTWWKENIPALAQYGDRDYGVAFEAPAFALEHIFRLEDPRQIYLFRHLLTFLVFVIGVYAVHRLSCRRFSDWRIGLLSAAFLVLTPRFFAESFYNSKDIVFMAAFAVAMNTTISFVLRPRIKVALTHGLATAVAVDVRIMGLLLVVVSVTFLIIRILRRELHLGRTCLLCAVYIVVSSVFVMLMWPYLWFRPLGHILQAFRNMAQFRWGTNEVRYMGSFIRATALPWHYPFIWIAITTPMLYLVLFVVGLCATCFRICANAMKLWRNDGELQDIVFLVMFVAPLASVLLLHSVLYDGWRQLYFIYPAFLLIATRGWVVLSSINSVRNVYRCGLVACTAISFVLMTIWMWTAHPLENVYFNIFAGTNLKARYELDYWGLGNRKALEYILENDRSPLINVWADSATPLSNSFLMLTPEDRRRIKEGNDRQIPYYVLTNYRMVNDTGNAKYAREYELFYEMKVNGEVVLSVFKWKKRAPGAENSGVVELAKP